MNHFTRAVGNKKGEDGGIGLRGHILASRATGRHLDTQTLKNHPSGHPKEFCEVYLKMSISGI